MGDHDPQSSTVSSASSSAYDPVLINPTSPFSPSSSSHPADAAHQPNVKLRLTYPFPLPLFALADLGYTARHCWVHTTAHYLLFLCLVRVAVLGGWVGLSRRWRTRGGYVAVISLVSVGAVVWEECQGVLTRSERRTEGNPTSVHTFFLLSTAVMSAFEYVRPFITQTRTKVDPQLAYLVLLRLSPPSHRINPLSMRLPPSEIQESTIWDFETTEAPVSPLRQRHSVDIDHSLRESRRRPSGSSYARAAAYGSLRRASVPAVQHQARSWEDGQTEEDEEEEDSGLWSGAHDEDEDDDLGRDDRSESSSISDSSIIDLPPPLAPERITIPPSISMTSGLSRVAAVMDSSPVLAPLVRRSRSARFLGKSWASRYSANEEMEARIASGRNGQGYGTFERDDEA